MLLHAAPAAALTLGGPVPTTTTHDNLQPAGRTGPDGLHLDLEIGRAMWYPNGTDRAGTSILAFGEVGAGPSTPGPLVRVRQGTQLTVSLHNTSKDTIAVHGLGARRGVAVFDSIVVPPGASRTTRFRADLQGTFFYWGARVGTSLEDREFDDALLNGAYVVDPAEGEPPVDRILLIDVLVERLPGDSGLEPAGDILAINGRPWPHTERMQATVGDSIRWRVINASQRAHPMHLHGFYFRVDAAGDWQADTLFDVRARRMAVTENMEPGTTRTLVWSPDRPGGWLFHCHLSFHAAMNAPLGEEWHGPAAHLMPAVFGSPNADADHHVERHMGGLMLVTRVLSREPRSPRPPAERTLRLVVLATADSNVVSRQYGYRLDDGTPYDRDAAARMPAPVLVLQRDQPTDIVVVNTTAEATSVHWHGIEIESYSDGVVGVGGDAHMPTPAIMPGDSFVARVTVPRSGSFMYHTHIADINQQGKGLAGGIVVVDDLDAYDASHERVYLAQTALDVTAENAVPKAVNRRRGELPVDTVRAGETYRLRFMNLTLEGAGLEYRFVSDRRPVLWTTVAKDGFTLPPWQQAFSSDGRKVSIGETVDVLWEVLPGNSGWLELRGGVGQLFVRQRIEVVGTTPTPEADG
ncbi:MAG: multicopper oxidase domain-containing protein [Gemmatimonadetes bacterium]|nr:multicopper oxidase domain-containing protein [Gemmatimonadota bacterium]